MKTCPRCGYVTQNDNAKFCYRCGEKMPEAYGKEANQPKTDENRTSEPIDDDGGIILGNTDSIDSGSVQPEISQHPHFPPQSPPREIFMLSLFVLALIAAIIALVVALNNSAREKPAVDADSTEVAIDLPVEDSLATDSAAAEPDPYSYKGDPYGEEAAADSAVAAEPDSYSYKDDPYGEEAAPVAEETPADTPSVDYDAEAAY